MNSTRSPSGSASRPGLVSITGMAPSCAPASRSGSALRPDGTPEQGAPRLDPGAGLFGSWLAAQIRARLGDAGTLVIALDGKTVRGAKAGDQKARARTYQTALGALFRGNPDRRRSRENSDPSN